MPSPVFIKIKYHNGSLNKRQLADLRISMVRHTARLLSKKGSVVSTDRIDLELRPVGEDDTLTHDVIIVVTYCDTRLLPEAQTGNVTTLRDFAHSALTRGRDCNWAGTIGVGMRFESMAWAEC